MSTLLSHEEDLPVNPFVALRVAYGMLLGEDDFRTLIGNPRGKQMLHSAWLHGPGVVWGCPVRREGTWTLKVDPGLAIDGQGRELLLDTTWEVEVDKWLKKQDLSGVKKDGGGTYLLDAHVVAEFRGCPTAPVPTLADPCDVTRKHDDFSRLAETTRVELRLGPRPPDPWPPGYHRVRVLFGLDEVGPGDEAGARAAEAARRVADAAPGERAGVMLREFRILAAHDGMDRRPAQQEGVAAPGLFPVTEDDAAVVLAAVTVTVRDADTFTEVVRVEPDPCVRRTLLPTATIQELACGLVPGLPDDAGGGDAGGPRVDPGSLGWSDDHRCLIVELTAGVNARSAQHAVSVTSLSDEGWVPEDINRIEYEAGPPHLLLIHLDDRPAYELVRVVIRGTGARPVYGTYPAVPLAGVVGGPPGTEHDGHDAVLTFRNPTAGRAEE